MSGPLSFIPFTIGASLASTLLNAVAEGSPPDFAAFDFDSAFRKGVRAWATIRQAAGEAQAEYAAYQAQSHDYEERVRERSHQQRRKIAVAPPS
jgi:hypothetical protein